MSLINPNLSSIYILFRVWIMTSGFIFGASWPLGLLQTVTLRLLPRTPRNSKNMIEIRNYYWSSRISRSNDP
jgi:hypothetical protein